MSANRTWILACVAAFPATVLGAASGTLTVSRDAGGDVIAAVDAMIPQCGVTAIGAAPVARIAGQRIDVQQPLAGVMCVIGIPPDSKKHYTASVNLGPLTNGTYEVTWSFPELSTTYTASDAPALGAGFTGTWYDPAQSGHGLQVEVLATDPPRALVTWYTFAPDGEATWISGSGTIAGNRISVQAAQVGGSGARFPPAYDATRVTATPWGTLTLRFADCNRGELAWHSIVPGYGDGVLPLVRLTLPAGLQCP